MTLCLAVLVLAQGGFFDLITCACGSIVCVVAGVLWLRKNLREERLPVIPLMLALLLVAYFVSAVVSGVSLTTLAESGSWAICVGIACIAAAQDERARSQTLAALCWLGVATAAAGLLTFAGWLPVVGGMVGSRLQFTFQYANAAAAWYAVATFLCLLAPSKRLRTMTFVPSTALLLTQSGGALVVFILVSIVVGVFWVRNKCWNELLQSLVQGALAAVSFAVFMLPLPALGVFFVGALCVLALRLEEQVSRRLAALDAKRASLVLVTLLVVGMGVAVVLMPERFAMAEASLVERGYQIRDGLRLWSQSPLTGVGPNNWQYLYPWVQTAPYAVTVVHSSAVQLLLDAGLFGFACFVTACLLGVMGLWRNVRSAGANHWGVAQLCAVAFLLIHSALEFDMQFASLACLLVLLLSGPTSPRVSAKRPVARGALAGVLCLALCLPFCAIGVLCSAASTAMSLANQQQRYDACMQLFEGVSLARIDVAAQEEYLRANFEAQRYNAVTSTYEHIPAPTNAGVLYAAIAYNVGGNTAKAAQTLTDRLEATRYDVELLEGAKRYEERFGIDPSQKARFDAAVATNEQLITSSEVTPT